MGARQESRLACREQPHQLCQGQNRVERHDIVFEINRKQGKTELRLRTSLSAFECYGGCSGMGLHIINSLRSLITLRKGTAQPDRRRESRKPLSDPGLEQRACRSSAAPEMMMEDAGKLTLAPGIS